MGPWDIVRLFACFFFLDDLSHAKASWLAIGEQAKRPVLSSDSPGLPRCAAFFSLVYAYMHVFLPSPPLLFRNCTVSRSTSSYPFQLQPQGPELRLRVTANSIVMQRASTRFWKCDKNGALARSTTSYMGSTTTPLVILLPRIPRRRWCREATQRLGRRVQKPR